MSSLEESHRHTVFNHAKDIARFRRFAIKERRGVSNDRVHHKHQRHACGEVDEPVATHVGRHGEVCEVVGLQKKAARLAIFMPVPSTSMDLKAQPPFFHFFFSNSCATATQRILSIPYHSPRPSLCPDIASRNNRTTRINWIGYSRLDNNINRVPH